MTVGGCVTLLSFFLVPWEWREDTVPITPMLRGLFSGLQHEMLSSQKSFSCQLWPIGLGGTRAAVDGKGQIPEIILS